MTYNPIDDNSDGVVDADVNNETVDTGEQSIGQSVTYPDGTIVTTNPGGETQGPTAVGTSATEIFSVDPNSSKWYQIMVTGQEQGSENTVFYDYIAAGYRNGGGPNIITSFSAGAAPHTYSKESINTSVELAMDANTYDVVCKAVSVVVP